MIPLLVTAFLFGFRHGFDWDHIAAIFDFATSSDDNRRAFVLSLLYSIGHALVVIVLGLTAILVGAVVPAGAEEAMGRVVGATLVALGAYVLVSVARHKAEFRPASRWMVSARLLARAQRWVRGLRRGARGSVRIEHEHEHPVQLPHGDGRHHDHPQPETDAIRLPLEVHTHRHEHDLPAGSGYGVLAAVGVGALHGVGAETPTQLFVFIAALGVSGVGAGLLVLVVFAVGLVASNGLLAAACAYGRIRAATHPRVYVGVVAAMGLFSIVTGTLFLTGSSGLLPSIA